MTKRIICIFHAQASGSFCDDGFGAAWAVRQRLGDEDVEFYPGVYGKPPPECTDRDVILVDFSYKRPVLEQIIAQANSVLILDHHKTALEDLSSLVGRNGKHAYSYAHVGEISPLSDGTSNRYAPLIGALGVTFDMERSGAGLAWDFFHPRFQRPEFINYLEDRDLWRKSLPGGDEFTIALRSFPQDFETWTALASRGVQNLITEGKSIQRYYRVRVEDLKKSAYLATWDHAETPDTMLPATSLMRFGIANAPYFAASEVAGEVAEMEGCDFGASYFEVAPGEWQYSLRSRGEVDVSEIAKVFGGGGHKGAAGFTVSRPVHLPIEKIDG